MSSSWYNELEEEPSALLMAAGQCDFMDYIDQELASILGQDFQNCFLPSKTKTDSSSSSTIISATASVSTDPPPAKQRKPHDFNSRKRASLEPVVLNFESGIPADENLQPPLISGDGGGDVCRNNIVGSETTGKAVVKKSRVRPPSQTYDHIMAERKRREQLSQRFVALSAIVPGLKKMDKTSVLGDAIKYMKHLQERVKTLEEQVSNQTVESVVLVKKSQITVEEEGSSDEKSWSSDEQHLPAIETRVCNRSILMKIHCEKRKGVLVRILAAVETLNLSVTNTSVASFGSLALDITIIAEMEKEIRLSAEEVVKALRFAVQSAAS